MKRLNKAWFLGLLALTSCATAGDDPSMAEGPDRATRPAAAHAAWAGDPVVLDGRLDEAVWQRAQAYPLTLPEPRARDDGERSPHEAGTVRFAWDRTHFYAAFELADRDVVQESDADQQLHFETGDVAELFLKPSPESSGSTHYWEFYVTPNGKKTAFFLPGRGRRGLPSNLTYQSGLKVAAQIDGSQNDWRDTDRGWTAEMAIPLEELTAAGVPLDPRRRWTVLAARYNYGRHLPDVELTSFPGLPRVNFHLHEAYAPIGLEPERP